MEEKLYNKICKNHSSKLFEFYCFDDNSFLCSKCYFDKHRNHKIEVKDNLKESIKIFKKLSQSNKSINEFFTNTKNTLEKVKKDIEEELVTINKFVQRIKSNSTPISNKSDIFSIPYSDYEKIAGISEIINKINEIINSLSDISKDFNKKIVKIPTNFRTISQEVKVLEKSQEHTGSEVDIMFGRKSNSNYTLFEGANNHYLVLDLGNNFYLKSIKINICSEFDCTLKNFKVSIKNENNKWEETNSFVCQKIEGGTEEYQDFSIEKEARYLRLDFINSWGTSHGNYILIKRILFEVGEIYEI